MEFHVHADDTQPSFVMIALILPPQFPGLKPVLSTVLDPDLEIRGGGGGHPDP